MPRDLSGQVLDGRYRVIEPIGTGGMGSVYRGEHLKLKRAVAIKVIADHVLADEVWRARLEREAMSMAKLEHPNCAAVLDVGVVGNTPYVVMEFVDGVSLEEVVRAGPLPAERAVEIVRQTLAGLSCAHEHGIVHRDIKPANIVLSRKAGLGDHVTILDFGLAKLHGQSSNLTSGLVIGTPSYMAPEQVLGREIDPRTDLYACGVLLFELLTGTKPFEPESGDAAAVCMMQVNVDPPKLRDKRPDVAFGTLEDVVAKALAKLPDERFANAAEFSEALGRPRMRTSPEAVDAHAETMALEPEPRRSRKPLAIALGGLALAAVAVAVAMAMSGGSEPPAAVQAAPPKLAPQPVEAAAPAPPPPQDPVADVLDRAERLVASGRRELAIDALVKARKAHPQDARLPYRAGLLYLDQMWWADGLKELRAAIALDPSLKSDATLIRAVVRGFNTTAQYDGTLASFLRDEIGAPAKAVLEDVAAHHPNALVRKRAAAELRRSYL